MTEDMTHGVEIRAGGSGDGGRDRVDDAGAPLTRKQLLDQMAREGQEDGLYDVHMTNEIPVQEGIVPPDPALFKGKTAEWWAEAAETQTARIRTLEWQLNQAREGWAEDRAKLEDVKSHIDHPSNKGMVATRLIRSILED